MPNTCSLSSGCPRFATSVLVVITPPLAPERNDRAIAIDGIERMATNPTSPIATLADDRSPRETRTAITATVGTSNHTSPAGLRIASSAAAARAEGNVARGRVHRPIVVTSEAQTSAIMRRRG